MPLYRSLLHMVSSSQVSLVTKSLILGASSADVPFCHWDTYIASGSPTLSRFTCVPTPQAGSTYGVTAPSTTTGSFLDVSPTSPSSSQPTPKTLNKALIAGASAGGASFLVLLAFLTWFFISRRRKTRRKNASRYELASGQDTDGDPGSRTPQSIPPPQYGFSQSQLPDVKTQSGQSRDGSSTAAVELPAEAVEDDSDLPLQPTSHLSQTSWLALDMGRLDTTE
ncbi:MAG: hypothetical protein M1839_002244 [Geoglossum umbratile]|nr:MAG: hypothetical protein M1839_002244 [Geoglossum umbratile]